MEKSASVLLVDKGSDIAFHWSVRRTSTWEAHMLLIIWPKTVILNGVSCVPMFERILGTLLYSLEQSLKTNQI